MLRIDYMDLSKVDDYLYEKMFRQVSSYRQKKANAYYLKEDRYLSVACGYLLETALKELGIQAKDIDIKKNAYGKPYVDNIPYYFNLSHSHQLAVCAISTEEVGIDVEWVKEYKDQVLGRIGTADEIVYIQRYGDQPRDFYRLWTAKESYLKYIGTGIQTSLKKIEVDLNTIQMKQQDVYLKEYTLNEYQIMVCSKNRDFPEFLNEIIISK